MTNFEQWSGFSGRLWKEGVNVRDFIQNNYTPYDGDESFLEGPTDSTNRLWGKLQELQKEERAKGGVLDMETEVVSGITAYGPAYIDESMKELEQVSPEQALKHPNWDMGAKITIDCATMMNKGLEIMEASWLFDMPIDRVDVVVHRESIIHSMVQFQDNSVLAQLGVPDMRIPIQYALTYPKRLRSPVKELDLTELGALTFFPPDEENFLCLKACKQAMILGGTAPAAANGANEQAVELFLQKKISFLDIGRMVSLAIERHTDRKLTGLEDILKADRNAREFVLREAD